MDSAKWEVQYFESSLWNVIADMDEYLPLPKLLAFLELYREVTWRAIQRLRRGEVVIAERPLPGMPFQAKGAFLLEEEEEPLWEG